MYEVRVADQAERQLKALDSTVRKRIRNKVDEIVGKISEGIAPNEAVEKRLRSPFHRFLQQRVGDYRLWFVDIPGEEILLLSYVLHKREAKRRLR